MVVIGRSPPPKLIAPHPSFIVNFSGISLFLTSPKRIPFSNSIIVTFGPKLYIIRSLAFLIVNILFSNMISLFVIYAPLLKKRCANPVGIAIINPKIAININLYIVNLLLENNANK